MAKYTGIRALGNMDPAARSAMLKLSRAMKRVDAVTGRLLVSERAVTSEPGVGTQRGDSLGGRVAPTTFGNFADRPQAEFLQKRGAGALVYVAVDTSTLYIWDGAAWSAA